MSKTERTIFAGIFVLMTRRLQRQQRLKSNGKGGQKNEQYSKNPDVGFYF